jgi:hypothetical protein
MDAKERRHKILGEEDIEAIALKLTEFSGLTPEDHKNHHELLELFIKEHKRKIERKEKWLQSTLGWFTVTVLGGLGTLVYHGLQWLIDHYKS